MDQSKGIYYCTIGDGSTAMSLLMVNLAAGTYNTTVIGKSELSPATYSPSMGCFFGYQGPEAVCINNQGATKTIIPKVNGIVMDGGWAVTNEGRAAGSLFAATVNLGPYFLMTYTIAQPFHPFTSFILYCII